MLLLRTIIGTRSYIGTGRCFYSSIPPTKSYTAKSTYLLLIWNRKVPLGFKYGGVVGMSALGIIHINPNIIITAGPPIAIAAYYLYKTMVHRIRQTQTNKVMQGRQPKTEVETLTYDETSIYNAVHGIENTYDHFKIQIVDILDQIIKDYITGTHQHDLKSLIDDNGQFAYSVDLNDIETFITTELKVPVGDKGELDEGAEKDREQENTTFIKFSLPVYNTKDKRTRKRLGLLSAYLLELDSNKNRTRYRLFVEFSKYSLIFESNVVGIDFVGSDIYKSALLKHLTKNSKVDTDDDMTVNI